MIPQEMPCCGHCVFCTLAVVWSSLRALALGVVYLPPRNGGRESPESILILTPERKNTKPSKPYVRLLTRGTLWLAVHERLLWLGANAGEARHCIEPGHGRLVTELPFDTCLHAASDDQMLLPDWQFSFDQKRITPCVGLFLEQPSKQEAQYGDGLW